MKKFFSIIVLLVTFCFASNSYSQNKLLINAGANIPMGTFGDSYKTGPSAEIGFVAFSLPASKLDLVVSAGYNSFSYKNDYFINQVKTNLGVGVTGFSPDWKASNISIMAGGRIKMSTGKFVPYAEGQLGFSMFSFSDRLTGQINASSSDPSNVSLNGATESGSETGLGAAFGLGTEISVAPKLALDFGVKYNYSGVTYAKVYKVFRNNNSQFTTQELKNPSYVTAKIGVVVNF